MELRWRKVKPEGSRRDFETDPEHLADELSLADMMGTEMREFVAAQQRPYFKEAVRAFIEKREPEFHELEARS